MWILTFAKLSVTLQLAAFASPPPLDIEAKVLLSGRRVAAPRLTVRGGQKARLQLAGLRAQDRLQMQLTTLPLPQDRFRVLYSVLYRENGQDTLSRGQIVLAQEQMGQIRMDRGRVEVLLQVRQRDLPISPPTTLSQF